MNFVWTQELQQAYEAALVLHNEAATQGESDSGHGRGQ